MFPAKAGRSLRYSKESCSGPEVAIPSCFGRRINPPYGGFIFLWVGGDEMPLGYYYPRPGDVLICNYETGFIAPEMIKHRPAVVISGRERHNGRLCTVVPLSATEPPKIQAWHTPVAVRIPGLDDCARWAKCDMLATVSFDRLDKPHTKHRDGRTYHTVQITAMELKAIRDGVLAYLHFP